MSMRRREFIQLLAGVAATRPLPARAQTPNPPRIGYLSPHSSLTASDRAFLQGLRELGYVEGSNIFIEFRFADGKFDRLPALAAELVRLDVAVIVTAVTQASLAAKASTKTILAPCPWPPWPFILREPCHAQPPQDDGERPIAIEAGGNRA